jgi:hypothetical protein
MKTAKDFFSSVGQFDPVYRSNVEYFFLNKEERDLVWRQIKKDSEEIQILFPYYNFGILKSFCHKDR